MASLARADGNGQAVHMRALPEVLGLFRIGQKFFDIFSLDPYHVLFDATQNA
jgi:hypothetical protein